MLADLGYGTSVDRFGYFDSVCACDSACYCDGIILVNNVFKAAAVKENVENIVFLRIAFSC